MQRIPSSFVVLSAIMATSLAGCNGNSPASQSGERVPGQAVTVQSSNSHIPAAPTNDADARASQLMAAAESFENLTESAFTSDAGKLDGLITKTKASADGVSQLLAPGERKALMGHVAAIGTARAADNRADLAIAAVEGYRTLVSNAGGHQKVPKQVSLLDYSGFRFQADLKAKPIRWRDAARAIDFADTQWQQISANVTDTTLRAQMSDALAAMRSASHGNDAKAAMIASNHELDLVDGLERYFAH